MLALRTLEFDRIVDAVTAMALTPLGSVALSEMEPSTDPAIVESWQAGTTETVTFLERHPLFPLRAGESLTPALDELTGGYDQMIDRLLEPWEGPDEWERLDPGERREIADHQIALWERFAEWGLRRAPAEKD
jgi:hypothetical protein